MEYEIDIRLISLVAREVITRNVVVTAAAADVVPEPAFAQLVGAAGDSAR